MKHTLGGTESATVIFCTFERFEENFCKITRNREFLGPSPSAFSGKNPESSLVPSQLGLRKWKLYVQIECQLGYLMMLISNGIYEGKYAVPNKNICHFLGLSQTRFPKKKSKAQ